MNNNFNKEFWIFCAIIIGAVIIAIANYKGLVYLGESIQYKSF